MKSADVLGAGLELLLSGSGVIITSRLHGIMHSLRAGLIPVVIDEVPDGGKVSSFSKEFGIPILLNYRQCNSEAIKASIKAVRTINTSKSIEILKAAQSSATANLKALILNISSVLGRG